MSAFLTTEGLQLGRCLRIYIKMNRFVYRSTDKPKYSFVCSPMLKSNILETAVCSVSDELHFSIFLKSY